RRDVRSGATRWRRARDAPRPAAAELDKMAHICDDRHPMKPLSRRTFLVGMPTATVALAVLPGCDKREKVVCDAPEKLSGLSAAERATRTSSQYIDSSKIAAKTCDNCAQYEPPSSADQCGGCKVVKGPINPGGYCNLWVEKTG